jgi:hypothetical protein
MEPEIGKNSEIIRERKVKLNQIEVRKRPDQAAAMLFEHGIITVAPIHVLALFTVEDEGEEIDCAFPCDASAGTIGMWFKDEDEWQAEEENFKLVVEKEMDRLRYVTQEKKSDGIRNVGV